MKYEIKNRWDGSTIYQDEADSFSALVQAAIKAKADLQSADLRSADLQSADLRSADLQYANLQSANLQSADLQYANLQSANLQSANLQSANLQSIKNGELAFAQTSIVPDHGPLFVWKKCRDNVLVRLFIPSKARRSNATGRKCRAERAKVLEVIGAEIGVSYFNSTFMYKVGQWVHANNWDEDRWNECSGGIHFFLTRVEAENYS